MKTFKVKDIIQDLRRYHADYDTNVIGIRKVDNEIIFEGKNVKDVSRESLSKKSQEIDNN